MVSKYHASRFNKINSSEFNGALNRVVTTKYYSLHHHHLLLLTFSSENIDNLEGTQDPSQ